MQTTVIRPTEVIVFGNPKVGTPLMICAQEVALDLPQKVLGLWIGFTDLFKFECCHDNYPFTDPAVRPRTKYFPANT